MIAAASDACMYTINDNVLEYGGNDEKYLFVVCCEPAIEIS